MEQIHVETDKKENIKSELLNIPLIATEDMKHVIPLSTDNDCIISCYHLLRPKGHCPRKHSNRSYQQNW